MTELVLPLVVRIERVDPPTRTDALEAAARGVLMMLTTTDPQWAEAVARWDGQRIRKVVRRARGAQWRRAGALGSIALTHRTAQLRVYPPVPIDAWPAELAQLQVGGTELADPLEPPPPSPAQPLILLSPHVEMTAGKSMAQAAHAAQLGWWASSSVARRRWQEADFALAVRRSSAAQWARALAEGAPVVHDGGFTEVEPDSQTALFIAARS